MTPVTDSKLSGAGAVPPTSKATTGLIPSLGKGRSGIFEKDWLDFVDRAHTRNSELSRQQVEYMLISMCKRAVRSHLTCTFPSNEETDQEIQPFINSLRKTPSADVPTSNNIVDDPPWNEVVARGVVANSKNASDNPPTFTSEEVPKPDVKDDISDEIMFEDDNTIDGVIPVPTTFNLLQKPSSSRPCFNFGLSSSPE